MRNGNGWFLTQQFDATSMPTTIRGVIAARIDRLDAERRRIIQEASVIGREFLFTVLSQVSGGEATLEEGLSELESADLIRKRSVDPDLEYLFKHALTQEVAYQGLLRRRRHELHGRVAQAMERLLGDRHREYAESIAYHFQNSDMPARAVKYLVIAGKKAIERYALAEAEMYYRSAYEILLEQAESAERDHSVLEVIVEWSLLHYHTGDFPAMNNLMKEHAELLNRVPDLELCGMWLTWHCFVWYCSARLQDSLAAADRAIALGEQCGSTRVLAYAYTQRSWALGVAGRSSDALVSSGKALALIDGLSDERDARYVRLKAGCGEALGWLSTGDLIRARAQAKELMDFAARSGSARALAFAYFATANISYGAGDVDRAITDGRRAREAALDPFYKGFIEPYLGLFLADAGRYQAAREVFEPALRFAEERGISVLAVTHRLTEALVLLGEGRLTRGMDQVESIERKAHEMRWGWFETFTSMTEARIYARIATGEAKASIAAIARNLLFVIGRGRRASRTARDALTELSENLSPDREGFRFQIEYELAKLLIKRKERDEARGHLEKAIAFLQPLGDSLGMRDARELLASLDRK